MTCDKKYNTGNPLCSGDPRDLFDNAKIIDSYVNSEEFEQPDRFDQPRKTWAGIEKDASDGLDVINQNAKEELDKFNDDANNAISGLEPKMEQLIEEKIIAGGGVDLTPYRKKDDNVFNGVMQIRAADGMDGTGIFLCEGEGRPRGQMVANSCGLQFAQVQDDGSVQTFTFPRYGNGGELVVKSSEGQSAINLSDLGAKNLEDCYDIYEEAVAKLGIKGGKIVFGSGKWVSRNGFTLYPNITLEGMGKGITILTQLKGQNKDILISKDFDKLKGVGPVKDAPKHIHVRDLTVDGNYLEDYKGASIHVDTTYNNTKGYGVKLFATKFTFDIELVNCAEVGWYSEAVNYTGYDDEHSSHITLDGRVFGKEAMVYRGVPDCNLNHIILGCAGWKATRAERKAECQMSELFEGQPVHVFVSDEQTPYNGHHEFTFMHLYGNYNGYGYYCNNTGRLKGSHLVVENCRGGFKSSARTWGSISILEAHNNGRMWAVDDSAELFYDIHNLSTGGFKVDAVIRQQKSQQRLAKAVLDEGANFTLNLTHFTIGSWSNSLDNTVITSTASSSTYIVNSRAPRGVLFASGGTSNKADLVVSNSNAPIIQYLSNTSYANDFSVVAKDCMTCVDNPHNSNKSNKVEVNGVFKSDATVLTGNQNTVLDVRAFKVGKGDINSDSSQIKNGSGTIVFDNPFYKTVRRENMSITTIPTSTIQSVSATDNTITIVTDSTTKDVILKISN